MKMVTLFIMILPVYTAGSILISQDQEEYMLLMTLILYLEIFSISPKICLNIVLLLLVPSVNWTALTWIFTLILQSSIAPMGSNPLQTFRIPPG